MKKILISICFLISTISIAQNDSIFNRLQAIKTNNGLTLYNIDGFEIASEIVNYPFTEKGIRKAYRKYSIKNRKNNSKDNQIKYDNFYINHEEKITENLIQKNSFYTVENQKKQITIIQFSSINKRDKDFERNMINHNMENTIPKENFASIKIDSINFVGRKIKLGTNCNWTNVNTVQCPYYGEMNWSVHKDLQDAKNTIEQQFEVTKSKKGGKIISEETVEIEFEGTETNAKKVILGFKGMKSLLVGMTGGKTLTIYYVATKVRENYVSCVLSFWNNDTITENGIAPLLEKVMKLKNN